MMCCLMALLKQDFVPACQGDWSPINTTRSIEANEEGCVHCSRFRAAFLLHFCLHASTQVNVSFWERLSLPSKGNTVVVVVVTVVIIIIVIAIIITFLSCLSMLLKGFLRRKIHK